MKITALWLLIVVSAATLLACNYLAIGAYFTWWPWVPTPQT